MEELLGDPQSPGKEKKKKKKKKEKKDKKVGDHSERNDDDDVVVKEKSKKKKKSKKKTVDDLSDALADSSLIATPEEGKKKATMDSSMVSPIPDNSNLLVSPEPSNKSTLNLVTQDYDKWGVEYFEALLEEIRSKCERKLKISKKDEDAFISTNQNFYDTWLEKKENDEWLTELLEGNNPKQKETGNQSIGSLVKDQTKYGKELDAMLTQRKKWSIKSALSVFMGLNEDSFSRIQQILVKGAIIAQMTPEKLADFASKSKQNKKLLKRLFDDSQLMKEMLLHGGAVKYEYGEAIRIFVDCMKVDKKSKKKKPKEQFDDEFEDDDEDFEDDEWSKVHRKIALACSLELASPIFEFDTAKKVDPVARFKHFVEAHKAGELDPSFPYFSVWEMRQIVNCDAPNDQMSWCRKMVSI